MGDHTSFVSPLNKGVAGAWLSVPLFVGSMTAGDSTTTAIAKLPSGVSADILAISIQASTVTSTPSLVVGNSTDPNGYLEAVNIATGATIDLPDGALSSAGEYRTQYLIADGGTVQAEVTTAAGEAVDDCVIVLHCVVQ